LAVSGLRANLKGDFGPGNGFSGSPMAIYTNVVLVLVVVVVVVVGVVVIRFSKASPNNSNNNSDAIV